MRMWRNWQTLGVERAEKWRFKSSHPYHMKECGSGEIGRRSSFKTCCLETLVSSNLTSRISFEMRKWRNRQTQQAQNLSLSVSVRVQISPSVPIFQAKVVDTKQATVACFKKCGCSSEARARACHVRSREFKSRHSLFFSCTCSQVGKAQLCKSCHREFKSHHVLLLCGDGARERLVRLIIVKSPGATPGSAMQRI